MKDKRIRVLKQHRAGCRMADRVSSMVNRGQLWLDVAGGYRGHGYPWHRYVCNSPDCGATALVRSAALGEVVNGWMEEPADA